MRWGDGSGGSGVLTTFLSWFGDTWQKGTLLLLENWGWVCIRAKWAGFTLSAYMCRIPFFPLLFLFFFIENSHIEDLGGLCLTTVTTLLCVASALSSTHCSASYPERQPGVAAGQLEGFWLVCLFDLHFRPAGAQTMIWSWRSWQVSSKICTSFRTLVQIEGSWCLPTAPAAFWSPHGAETGRVIITIIVNVINDHMHNAQTLRWNWKVAVD